MQPKSTHSAGADNVFSSVADPNLNPSVISSTMAISEVISTLVSNGCPDVTGDLDPKRCGNHPISGGGFGDVYQGRLTNNKSIAIKCARLYLLQGNDGYKVLKRAARELHAWSTLRHENILELVGLALFRDQLSMISPWMDGGALPDYIERNPNVDRLQLCSQISTGLTYLHQSGMTHGDVKGLNGLISKCGVAKLTDFGNTVLKNYTLQFTGVISASNYTLRWAAPELLDGTLNVCNEKADVYALGMTILEVITGEVPFRDKPDQVIFNYVVLKHGIPTRPTTLLSTTEESAGVLWRLLLQCWGHDPNARPTSTSVQTSLDSILLSKAVGKLESGNKKVACSPQGSSNTVAETLSIFEPRERPVGEQSRPSISTDDHNYIPQTTDTDSYYTRLLPSPPATGRASSRPSLKIDLTNASHYRPSSETEYCGVSDVRIPPTTTADAGQYHPVTRINTGYLGKIRDVIGKLNSDKETPGEPANVANTGDASISGKGPSREWNHDNFEVLRRLGEGASGLVVEVRDITTGKIMARKTISTGSYPATQLLRELEVCQLDHPNIVHFYGAYLYSQSDSSEVNFLMEYCEGGSFDAIMRQLRIHSPGIRIAERVQARLAREVLQGLDFIHSKSLIHRDIKPSNILVTKGGVVKICDFGVSGVLEASLASTFTGTSWYMAPERISGHTYSIRADIWSLGITFLELALHRFPYPDDLGPIELVTYIYNGEAPVLTDEPASDGHGEIVWSDEMKAFIKQCLCKDAAARPRPRDLLKHPWILADIDRDVDMAEFIREVWGWPETTKHISA